MSLNLPSRITKISFMRAVVLSKYVDVRDLLPQANTLPEF
jgi:hypothetical protein